MCGIPDAKFRVPSTGNDVPGALDSYPVANTHIFAQHFILIVQGCAAYRDAGHIDGPEERDRCQLAGATHLHGDIHDVGQLLTRFELERDRPPGRARASPELCLLIVAIDFDDDTIELIVELVPLGLELVVIRHDFIEGLAEPGALLDTKTPLRQRAQRRGLRAERLPPAVDDVHDVIGEQVEGAASGDAGIELT